MEFKLKLHNRDISEKELLEDLKRVNEQIPNKLTRNTYNQLGKYSSSTYEKRFGSWGSALMKAGLELSQKRDISNEELFKNLEDVCIQLGRQPKYAEIKQPLSRYSIMPYHNRFGKWNNVLQAFVKYINSDVDTEEKLENPNEEKESLETKIIHKTKREISDRLRFRILMRDGFTCKRCGRSPINEIGVELHVDHILPWSKGGETIPENLETKCKKCNLGKGNEFAV